MTTIFIHVGQCGNQVGQQFWSICQRDKRLLDSGSFYTHDGMQHSIHIDSEPKVIQQFPNRSHIRDQNIVLGKRGRGTNWALGYNGAPSGVEKHLLENSMEALRKEIERCDRYMGTVFMHSLSGGTGAGFGSRLIETVREEYPMNLLMSVTFAPCVSGESPLQHYNSLLTLAWLQRYTDGVILFYNDEILGRLQKSESKTSVSFGAINRSIANHLCGILLPTDTLLSRSKCSVGLEPWEMLQLLCPLPDTKFLHLLHRSSSKGTWEDLTKQALQSLQRRDREGNAFQSLGNLVVARGDEPGNVYLSLDRGLDRRIADVYKCVTWNPEPLNVWTAVKNYTHSKQPKSLTIASNYSSTAHFLDHVCQRSKVKYDAGAYLHWYWRYGATKEMFEEAMETLQTTAADYRDAVR